jgi:N-carbamoylputrescine amidase
MAVAICYDGWFPETYRLAALQGADILCVPTNWVPMPNQPPNTMVMANIPAMGGAHSNSMYVAAADRMGVERDQPFLGCSLIVSHTGFPLAGPASAMDEAIVYAEVNLSDARRKRVLNSFNHPCAIGRQSGRPARRVCAGSVAARNCNDIRPPRFAPHLARHLHECHPPAFV